MKSLAQFFSWVLHPIFMPLLTLFVAFQIDPKLSYFLPSDFLLRFFGLLGIMTIAFPGISILMLKRMGQISSLTMPERKERIRPFTLTLFYYGVAYVFLLRIPLDSAIYCMLLGAMLALILTILITFSWKISVHMIGIGGLIGCVIALMRYHHLQDLTYLLGSLLILAGILGSSRILLKAHSPSEVYGGFLLGLSCVFTIVAIGQPILF